jgi:hypothetical protein
MHAYDRLLLPENLNYAWLKAKRLYQSFDGYIDTGELAAFEIGLERNLLDIRRQFERGSYRLKKLRPLPRPKKVSEGNPVDRQYYHIAVEDQVAWIAVVNALGPELDKRMPAWSYGNRLYRPAWYDRTEESVSTLEIGPYRHASGQLYRRFQHSWPLFRRHVALTSRLMVAKGELRPEDMDEGDQLAAASAKREQLIYFNSGFWSPEVKTGTKKELYHASIDLKQFYPQLSIEAVLTGLNSVDSAADARMQTLLTDMLRFRLDFSDMPESIYQSVEPRFLKRNVRGIPTGLFVAGFLANAAMLPIDSAVEQELLVRKSIAHFRFVDDHTIIAYDFDALCDWIAWYESLLAAHAIGAEINKEKYDPPSLGRWMTRRKKVGASGEPMSEQAKKNLNALRSKAVNETRLDGKNPTKLMTKTLAQVSAIAATDIHILDDEDLEERLKMLEWLLLADIPEREIRPDTRAAFAAGQIATLAPLLVQEGDGLVDVARHLAELRSRKPDPERSTSDERDQYEKLLNELETQKRGYLRAHEDGEKSFLSRCLSLLLQAFREHPGKARLFYRIHQFCRVTGYKGLREIAGWIKETRDDGKATWADYYSGLSLQILARGILAATRQLQTPDTQRSEIKAALQHIKDVEDIDLSVFCVPREREAWFHAVGRKEFGVALLQTAEILSDRTDWGLSAERLKAIARVCIPVTVGASAQEWQAGTGWTSGVWAHRAEDIIGDGASPSAAWLAFNAFFAFERRTDAQAARRYPEFFPESGWTQLLQAADPPPESDSGWLREVIGADFAKRQAAMASRKAAFIRAARAVEPAPKGWMTIEEWTHSVRDCSPFDPRRSEWTALEIVAQLVGRVESIDGDETMLDRLHSNNVLLPRRWIADFACDSDSTEVSWETWRKFAQSTENDQAILRGPSTCLVDYRYAVNNKTGIPLPESEKRLVAVGRLLLGLLRNNHAAPRTWNLRGNEQILRLPRARWLDALAISSPTLLLVEGCLSARSAETRSIAREPQYFGWRDGEVANDAEFDPPLLFGTTALQKEIRRAQKILEENQLAVTMNQPRQLIPFRLSDFAATADDAEVYGDGGDDAQ